MKSSRSEMVPERKVWGTVVHRYLNNGRLLQSHLEVRRGFRCSQHRHLQRHNSFLSISALLCIEVWPGEDLAVPPERVLLEPGDSYTVPAGLYHRFRVLEAGEVVETYWPTDDAVAVYLNDIERLDEGGPDLP